ncbi:Transcriptional regulator [Collimonas arenae]|uniref:Transcriptional regulator n=1 Tax=Collimonas arenae TaxID=279058 RepID=A0A0A1F6C5_9BURK|nr:PLP-dependent aminotransferase family protein [Collimonas arenae]AIY39229.1 Transcriptional regulator [Collimonas arenae]
MTVPQKTLPLPLPLDRQSALGLVEQVVAALSQLIDSGKLRPGERLPSIRRFAEEQGVSNSTIVEAYERLVANGMLHVRRGAGFFIAKQDVAGTSGMPAIRLNPVIDSAWLFSEVFADERVPIKAGCGWLPSSMLDGEGLHAAERRIIRSPGAQQVGYGHPFGYGPLRQTIAKSFANWSLDIAPDQVVTTHGVTQALDLIMRTLVKPGDTVFIEEPGYCNLIAMLRLAAINVIGVPRTVSGVDLDALEQLARLHKPKIFFTNPVLQNPTGTTYTPACAMQVLQAAERHGFWVVEDDLYRELAQATDPMLAALDGLRRVIYVSGFSKTIAPSLRLGFIVCQSDLAREFARTKMVLTLTNSEITERLVYNALTEGHHRRHVERLAGTLLTAQAQVSARLQDAGLQPFGPLRGGMFYWASMPHSALSATEIADRALQQGIWLAPGEFFHVAQPERPWFRFNVAFSDVAKLSDFFSKLK